MPCVLYNGKNNWTVCRSFGETLEGNEQLKEYMLDFKYILFDVKRYDENKLINLANVIGAAFFMDQKSDAKEIVNRLKKLINLMDNMEQEDFNVFRRWVKNILKRVLPNESARQVEEIMEKNEEAKSMVYAIEEAIIKEREESKMEGKIEGKIEGKMEEKVQNLTRLITRKFGIMPAEQKARLESATMEKLDDIIENIFDISSLEELDKFLE